MAPVGKKKLAEKAAKRLGEPVEAATGVGPGGSLGGQIAKTMLIPKPAEMLTLVVTSDSLRLFKGTLRDDFHEERFARPCSEITQIERRKGALGDRIRVTFRDGERLEFKSVHGAAHGRDVVDLIAAKASISIDALGKE
jgi:hypothetical protein